MAHTPTPQMDVTLLSGSVAEIGRDLRLLRLQIDIIAGRLANQAVRFTGIEGRLATVEQSIHELIGETARGFGQQQQLTRIEQRFDAVDTGLADIAAALAANHSKSLALIATKLG